MILEIKSFQFLVNESFFKNRILAEFMESCVFFFSLTFFFNFFLNLPSFKCRSAARSIYHWWPNRVDGDPFYKRRLTPGSPGPFPSSGWCSKDPRQVLNNRHLYPQRRLQARGQGACRFGVWQEPSSWPTEAVPSRPRTGKG